jgi:hypothetical protein
MGIATRRARAYPKKIILHHRVRFMIP